VWCMSVCGLAYSMECTESEKAAAEKRDVVKAKVDEINGKLSQLNENKKEKMKDAKKTRKYCISSINLDPLIIRTPKFSLENNYFLLLIIRTPDSNNSITPDQYYHNVRNCQVII